MADLSITAANVALVSGNTAEATAGATITAGQALYLDATDSDKAKLCDVDASAAAAAFVGIALNGASSGQPVDYAKPGATVNMGATVAIGTVYMASGTAGGVAPYADYTTGDFGTIIGIGLTAANLKIVGTTTGIASA